jgi:tetratricopeptide (TPR) repeat protein
VISVDELGLHVLARVIAFCEVITIVTLIPLGGRAQDVDRATQARAIALFEQANVAYRDGRFGEAAELLRDAVELYPHPNLVYNLGRAQESMGDLSAAIATYERYLELDGVRDADLVRHRVGTLRRLHRERQALVDQRLSAIRERDELVAQLEEEREASISRGPVPWIVAGVGVLGVGGAILLWQLAVAENDRAEIAPTQREAFDHAGNAKTLLHASWATVVAGGALLLAGATWGTIGLLSRPGGDGLRELALELGPTSLVLSGAFE